MTSIRHALAAAAATLVLGLGPGSAEARIPLELRFDGRPFHSEAPPEFTCFNATLGRWVGCRVQPTETPGSWVLERPAPGAYRMHVSIDDNLANPRRFPGDYEAQVRFEVTETAPERIVVDLPRLIHLLRPGDNGRALEGMLTGCATQPTFFTERHAWTARAPLEFAWDPVVVGAEYRYTVTTLPCGPSGARREITNGRTAATAVTLTLPPTPGGESYVFRVEAWKDGRLAGDLYTHDGGAHSWNYRFQVRDATLPRWAWAAAAAGLLILLLAGYRGLGTVARDVRRRRLRRLAVAVVLLLLAGGAAAGGLLYSLEQTRRRAEAAWTAAEAARQARQREFIAAFASAAPRPDWWAGVETPYRVDSVGDLLAAWQGHPRSELGERQFFKAAYQGIVDHSDDEHVVATALSLLPYVAADYPAQFGLARFGYERYFRHRQRTDNCVNCMVGDTTQALALNLSRRYAAAGRHDEAIEVCRRVIDERGADVSPYKLAETWNQISWVYWGRGDRERAIETIRGALERYRDTVRREELERSLAHFESKLQR